MENNRCLNELSLALYKKRKERNFLILQHLRRQQFLIYGLLQRNATQRSIWKLNRQSSFWEINCNCHFFETHFRMNRASFDTLCGLLKNLDKADTNFRNAIPLQKRVAIALFTLGSSGEYRVVSGLFSVGISTVCTILWEFCEEVWQALSAQYIKKLPPTPETLDDCVDGFHRLGFPQCLGAIDGCHIEVRPNPADACDYYNYKGWYSIVLLAVVDYRYRFLYVNYKLSKCRRVVENAFGPLKGRFRRIGKGLDNRIQKAPIIIKACCVLHNFLNEMNDTINGMWLERMEGSRNRETPEDNVVIGDSKPSAEEIRQGKCNYFRAAAEAEVLGIGDDGDASGGEGDGSGVVGSGERGDIGDDNAGLSRDTCEVLSNSA